MRKFLKILLKIIIAIIAAGILIFSVLWLAVPDNDYLNRVINIDGSPALYDNEERLFHLRLSPDSEWQIPIKLNEMGKWLPLVAVGVEDGRFYKHFGVDFIAIMRAAYQNIFSLYSKGRVASGASTITSQLIRLAISEREGRSRNINTKIREFIMAMKLERVFSKPEILENYLNRAPFGGNIRGVQAASLIYFGKPASKISTGEACLLIGMLKSPTLYRPDIQPKAAKMRRDAIIKLMEHKKIFTHDEAMRALLEELPRKKTPPPFRAYHFAELVFNRVGRTNKNIYTSLDLSAQTKLESILRQAARNLPTNITLAAGIADNKTGNLIAWVGNARFGENNLNLNSKSTWVDCGLGARSPGSTLKPFAYLSAVEQGILTGSTLLADTQMAFSGRAPRNFDLQYRGAVSARVALAESLNAPAVRVLRRAGQDNVLRLLREFGFKHLTNPAKYYGDSLILGGCEVTLFEELEAFTALASSGVHRPLSLLKDNLNNNFKSQIASPEACWIVCDILNHKGALSLFSRGTLGQKWQIALKTGTSYGLRDAWTAAWTPDFTTVVWVGSPDGSAWTGLVGASAAAPVAVSILRAVSPKSGWYDKPDKVIARRVCSLSGEPPTAVCPVTRPEWHIDGVTHTVPCKLHTLKDGQKILIMPSSLRPLKPVKITGIYKPRGGERYIYKKTPLTIVSPISGATYITTPFDLNRNIPMRAEGASGNIWWYMDGKYIGSSEAGATFFHGADDGEHIIGVTDEDGRSASINIKVITPGRKQAPVIN